ncbi:MAG: hypothetical protein IJY98_05475, partial [Bacteroidaceae bacterium]|nr:hypothetical protein [Bacteroidaceae bacterium]
RGRYIVTPGTRTIDHTVSVNYLEDRKAYRIACIDMVYNDPFGGESGEDLIVITLKAAEDAVTGVYEFKLTEMELTTTAQEAVNPDTYIGEVTIEGDENGIEDILAEGAEGDAAIYDLTGRAVKEATTPGIYIVGGKKIFVK